MNRNLQREISLEKSKIYIQSNFDACRRILSSEKRESRSEVQVNKFIKLFHLLFTFLVYIIIETKKEKN